MTLPTISLVIKDYDYVAPLACGDVVPNGITLRLERDTPGALDRTLKDPAVDAGELSLSRHLMRLSDGDHSFVGIPFFAYRAFRHRCFFVRRDSGLSDLKHLGGKCMGTNEWPASGNVWSRALLREQGVPLSSIQWWIGPVDNPDAPRRPQGMLPPYVEQVSPGQTLRGLLLAGRLDALMCPVPPQGFYEPGSPMVRLLGDYRRAEQEYFRRTHLYPPHHIIGIRREAFERNPGVARSLYDALEHSRRLWQERRRAWAEVSPWYLAELEDVTALMGTDWQLNGVAANNLAIEAFCEELLAQELIPRSLDAAMVFAEFEQSYAG